MRFQLFFRLWGQGKTIFVGLRSSAIISTLFYPYLSALVKNNEKNVLLHNSVLILMVPGMHRLPPEFEPQSLRQPAAGLAKSNRRMPDGVADAKPLSLIKAQDAAGATEYIANAANPGDSAEGNRPGHTSGGAQIDVLGRNWRSQKRCARHGSRG